MSVTITTNGTSIELSFTPQNLDDKIDEMIRVLQESQKQDFERQGYTHEVPKIVRHDRRKFIAVDIGGSGVFLVERATGELYNIKGYGVPDYNKKKKADLGNIFTADLTALLGRRWNYLR